jgi:methylthioribose-1-phosphate isomerase
VPHASAVPAADRIAAIAWDAGAPVIIDQRRLPEELVHWRLASVDAVVEAIQTLAVRGAPAIGITGAYGLALGLAATDDTTPGDTRAQAAVLAARLRTARPTAVNLSYAVDRVHRAVERAPDDVHAMREAALEEARAIHEEDAT